MWPISALHSNGAVHVDTPRQLNPTYLAKNEVSIMQYTGLKDKNGEEIYEGDVLLIPDTWTETVDVGVGSVPVAQTLDNHLAPVEFKDGEFVFVIKGSNADILSDGYYTWNQLKEETGVEEIEIIGNIYENPELTQTHENK